VPGFEWESAFGGFIKRCPSCDLVVFGTEEQKTSEFIFSKYFGNDPHSTDGFKRQCKSCKVNSSSGRKQNGKHRDKILEEQEYKCAICDTGISFDYLLGMRSSAKMDHNHTTGEIRGVLCHRCNTLMSSLDDEEWLSKALKYRAKYV
jgi:hypothetical protein